MSKGDRTRAHVSAWPPAGPDRGRAGMTLIEILIATGILAVGLIGLLSLFLLAIRNVSTTVGRTMAASVAKQVIVSFDHDALDLGALDVPYTGVSAVPYVSGLALDGGTTALCEAIHSHHVNVFNIGHGVPVSCFRIPECSELPDYLKGDPDGDGTPEYVAVRWEYDPVKKRRRRSPYGWTATFMPIETGDNDGQHDEDPDVDGSDDDGDGSDGEDPVTITDHTTYFVQVAVWRDYRLFSGLGSPTGDFTAADAAPDNNRTVVIHNAADEFWDTVRPGTYIRHKGIGIWYQVSSVSKPNVMLSGEFWHPVSGTHTGEVEVASRFRLVALYDTVLRPGQ